MMVITTVLYLMMMLNVVTWNITGIMSSAGYLSDILDEGNIDICGLSEHWLTQKNFHFMDSISSEFMHYTVCDINNVRKCGVSIMWHRRYNNLISEVETDSDRIIGIQLEIGSSLFVYFFKFICHVVTIL
jgi:exonuclease III